MGLGCGPHTWTSFISEAYSALNRKCPASEVVYLDDY